MYIYLYIYVCVCVCVCVYVYCYTCPDFLRFEMGALCVSSVHLNVLRGEFNHQCFKMLLKKESNTVSIKFSSFFKKLTFMCFNNLAY